MQIPIHISSPKASRNLKWKKKLINLWCWFLYWSAGRVKIFIFSFFFIKWNLPSLLLEFLFSLLTAFMFYMCDDEKAIKILKMALVGSAIYLKIIFFIAKFLKLLKSVNGMQDFATNWIYLFDHAKRRVQNGEMRFLDLVSMLII